jgi:hypothetical protein
MKAPLLTLTLVVTVSVVMVLLIYGGGHLNQDQKLSQPQPAVRTSPQNVIPRDMRQGTETNETRQLKLIFQSNSTVSLTEQMDVKQADTNFFNYVSYLHYHCEDYIRLGNSFDGGWDMCVVGPYQPTRPCLIYSFGINNDFSFDDAASIKLGCTIRAFDPSMKSKDHRRGPNIWFYQVGIGDKDETNSAGWKLRTLDSLIRDYDDTAKIIDYLKMDVEGSEWDSVANMCSTGVLDRVKQFGLEIHVGAKTFYKYYLILKQLEERGFRRWYWAMNFRASNIYVERPGVSRSCCYEMVYINTKYL